MLHSLMSLFENSPLSRESSPSGDPIVRKRNDTVPQATLEHVPRSFAAQGPLAVSKCGVYIAVADELSSVVTLYESTCLVAVARLEMQWHYSDGMEEQQPSSLRGTFFSSIMWCGRALLVLMRSDGRTVLLPTDLLEDSSANETRQSDEEEEESAEQTKQSRKGHGTVLLERHSLAIAADASETKRYAIGVATHLGASVAIAKVDPCSVLARVPLTSITCTCVDVAWTSTSEIVAVVFTGAAAVLYRIDGSHTVTVISHLLVGQH